MRLQTHLRPWRDGSSKTTATSARWEQQQAYQSYRQGKQADPQPVAQPQKPWWQRAGEFGREAFRILTWAEEQPGLAEAVRGQERRARASAWRVDARYRLDGGQAAESLASWWRAFSIHPPTALARWNLLFSALLDITGLRRLRTALLNLRRRRWTV